MIPSTTSATTASVLSTSARVAWAWLLTTGSRDVRGGLGRVRTGVERPRIVGGDGVRPDPVRGSVVRRTYQPQQACPARALDQHRGLGRVVGPVP